MINGKKNDFLPSNFWFVDDYNLLRRFPNNPDIINANVIIASCLGVNPKDRCDYSFLISQIESLVDNKEIIIETEIKQKVKLYQEKRKMELIEIKEKKRLLVNNFSQCYVRALE